MILEEIEARKIIDLNPSLIMDLDITERQFQVILKGFNYLIQENSDFLYIADEVGLGKTYVALGIASLLRHFCNAERRYFYKDMIIVPKKNLQYKWVKEINNFVNNNFLPKDNIVKSVLDIPIGKCNETNIHHSLDSFSKEIPSYEIYRNSSFSVSKSIDDSWIDQLENNLPEYLRDDFRLGRRLYKKEKNIHLLKRLYAYLLNISFPVIDLLIVDEAHHYKHGIGEEVAYRNQLVSRLMGVIQEEDDYQIFEDFPQLKEKIKPKAKKVIFLSATPIDNGLHEIKQQLDCFITNHQFKNSENISSDIKKELNSFMIRGLMKLSLTTEKNISRNMYRYEHRKGNVKKLENALPQYIDDDLEAMVIGFMQFETLKHLNKSNNKSFEIGMLAGFETFNSNSVGDKEYEETSIQAQKSEDFNVIKNISESYFDTFKQYLPHPKQDNIIKVLLEGIKKGEKSLVFVRRIASVVELERKLYQEIELWEFSKIKKYISKAPKLKTFKKAFDERYKIVEIEKTLRTLATRVFKENVSFFKENFQYSEIDEIETIYEIFLSKYYAEDDSAALNKFRIELKNHLKRSTVSSNFKFIGKKIIDSYLNDLNEDNLEDDADQSSEKNTEVSSYFFSSYFSSKRYPDGFNFRKRAATKDWYRFNIFHLKSIVKDLQFDSNKLPKLEFTDKERVDSRRMDKVIATLFDARIETIESREYGIDDVYKKRTFFNKLFEEVVSKEFEDWVNIKWKKPSKGYTFFDDFEALLEIFQGVFRNGSGIVPAYIADALKEGEFEDNLIEILVESYPEIIQELKKIIIDFDKIISTNFSNRAQIQTALYGQEPIAGVSGFHNRNVRKVATQFRMPGQPYVLITTDILKEGEDLHLYCKDVYHYGIAWNPSDMEQRTGRIDRINSQCYFGLKKEGKRSFENALQVFYPYLADTLEVNQVAKVFLKMNEFIDTFYEIAIVREKDSSVSTEAIIQEIPQQRKEELNSKYDYQKFTGLINNDKKNNLYMQVNIGETEEELKQGLDSVFQLVNSQFYFIMKPKFRDIGFGFSANINLNNRAAPLEIKLVHKENDIDIVYQIDSIICRSSELRRNKDREDIRKLLKKDALQLIINNDFLLVRDTLPFKEQPQIIIDKILEVISIADNIESRYTNGGDFGMEEFLN